MVAEEAELLRCFAPRNDKSPNRHCERSEANPEMLIVVNVPLIVLTQQDQFGLVDW
jgi:hypothetical protein